MKLPFPHQLVLAAVSILIYAEPNSLTMRQQGYELIDARHIPLRFCLTMFMNHNFMNHDYD